MDFSDLVILARNYGRQVSSTAGATVTAEFVPSLGANDLLAGGLGMRRRIRR